MTDVLNKNIFFVREQPRMLKLVHNYDILDPATGQVIMACREEPLRRLTKLLRYTNLLRRTTPFNIRVRTPDGQPVLRMTRGVPVFASTVQVFDGSNTLVGLFRQKLLSISGAFDVLDAMEQPVCRLVGGLSGWNFRFLAPGDVELARVTKKWGGLGKEFFTSADDYVLQIDEIVPANSVVRHLILASVLCVGLIQKIEIP